MLNDLVDRKDYTSLKRSLSGGDRCGMQQIEERWQRPALLHTAERTIIIYLLTRSINQSINQDILYRAKCCD